MAKPIAEAIRVVWNDRVLAERAGYPLRLMVLPGDAVSSDEAIEVAVGPWNPHRLIDRNGNAWSWETIDPGELHPKAIDSKVAAAVDRWVAECAPNVWALDDTDKPHA